MKRSPGILAAIAITLSLTACGATDSPENTEAPASEPTATETEEPQLYPAGPFELTSAAGAEITFELPTPVTDESLAEIEQFRTDTGGTPVSYLVIKVDNRNGTEPVTLEEVTAFDTDGTRYEFSSVSDFIGEWSPHYTENDDYVRLDGTTISAEEGGALYNRGVDLYNAQLGEIAVAESSFIILASQDVDLPNEFTRVAVFPDAFATDGEEATPPGSTVSE